jgi:hypothetical protein
MADVAIARYDATTGWLPPICPKHGVRADRVITRKFSTPTPAWVFLFLLLGVLPLIIAAACVRKSDVVTMPGCHECDVAGRTRLQIRWGTGIAALVAFVAACVTASPWLFLVAFVVVVAWLLALSSTLNSLGAVTGTLDGPWLRLKGVHPAFVAALRPNPAWQRQPQPAAAVYHVPALAPYRQTPYSG